MPEFCVIVDEPLSRGLLRYGLQDSISIQGRTYSINPRDEDEVVFYDWILGDGDVVRGLEICLLPSDPLLRSRIPLASISSVDADPDDFVRIWLGTSRVDNERVLQAFGDISFYSSDDSRLAIVVGMEMWLTPPQRNSLLAHGWLT